MRTLIVVLAALAACCRTWLPDERVLVLVSVATGTTPSAASISDAKAVEAAARKSPMMRMQP